MNKTLQQFAAWSLALFCSLSIVVQMPIPEGNEDDFGVARWVCSEQLPIEADGQSV